MNQRDGQLRVDCPPDTAGARIETQPSRLLNLLFEKLQADQRLSVLNIGPALPETISFFANYRCRLHIVDLLAELPVRSDPVDAEAETQIPLQADIAGILSIPDGVIFDLVFFWDALNYLSKDEISALMQVLRPHLHGNSRGHCFAAHNADTAEAQVIHGIQDADHLSVRRRLTRPRNYRPVPQGRLMALLEFFTLDRSVLMRDRRLELLLKVING